MPANAFESGTGELTLPTPFALKFSVRLCRETRERCPRRKRGQAGVVQWVPLGARSLGDLPGTVLQAPRPAGECGGPAPCSGGTRERHDTATLPMVLNEENKQTIKMFCKELKLNRKQLAESHLHVLSMGYDRRLLSVKPMVQSFLLPYYVGNDRGRTSGKPRSGLSWCSWALTPGHRQFGEYHREGGLPLKFFPRNRASKDKFEVILPDRLRTFLSIITEVTGFIIFKVC